MLPQRTDPVSYMVLDQTANPDYFDSYSYYRQWTREDWEAIEPQRYHRVFTHPVNGIDTAIKNKNLTIEYNLDWEITKICENEYVLVNRGENGRINLMFRGNEIVVWNVEGLA